MTNVGTDTTTSLLSTGVILGVGLVGALDEVILHQWLQWHNFYVHTTQDWRIVSDGVFHAVTSGLLFLGALRLWAIRGRAAVSGAGRALASGILLGMGGFNLYDGTVQHKLLRFHPVREGVDNILPYDLAFNAIAVVLLVAGWLLWRTARSSATGNPRLRAHAGSGMGKAATR